MPLPLIAGTVRAAVVGTVQGGGPWVNVWHWRYALGASTPGPIEIDNLHTLFARFYFGTPFGAGAPWLNACASGTTISRIDYTVLNGEALGYTKSITGAGTGGTNTLPGEVAAVLGLRTNTRGRRYRGRLYLPAPANSATVLDAAGKLSATVIGATQNQYSGLKTAANAIQWAPVVASYGKSLVKDPNDKWDKIEVTWAPFATDITAWPMDGVLDVQRKRKA